MTQEIGPKTIKEQMISRKLQELAEIVSSLGRIGCFLKISNEVTPKLGALKARVMHHVLLEDHEVKRKIEAKFGEEIEVDIEGQKMAPTSMSLRTH